MSWRLHQDTRVNEQAVKGAFDDPVSSVNHLVSVSVGRGDFYRNANTSDKNWKLFQRLGCFFSNFVLFHA